LFVSTVLLFGIVRAAAQTPPRDNAERQDSGSARISGRVVSATSSRPLRILDFRRPLSLCRSGAQVRVRVGSVLDLSESLDESAARRYLDAIDEEIGKIATEYRQLADWNVAKGPQWSDSGKGKTASRLEYAHARRVSQRPTALSDRFGPDGFELEVRVIPRRSMAMLAGPSVGTFVFGGSLADGCVIATLLLADPERRQNVQLAHRVTAIVTKPLGAAQRESCLP
jgi:hypothetical protein